MSEIQVLDQRTIDKIAAGEVVERPSSIAKELVENALDAGATRITVEIRDGGIRLLRVTDNGKGIPADEVRLAFLRHATSKLRTVGDFGTLTTLGFRGEALSSIAAVSRVEMITKRAGEMTGTRYCIEGGRERLLEEVGAPEGTTILVRDIFYNTPARAKFLKTAQTEAAHVGNFMEKLALAKPSVAFEFLSNGDSKLLTTGNGNLKDVIYQIYGREAASELVPVDVSAPELRVTGVLARPSICRSTRNFEMYFVNGRYVKSRIVSAAIEEGYGTMLMKHMYPFTCLFLDVKGTNVDVNVHPTKMEVRFSNEKGVFAAVKEAVESTLKGQEMIVRSLLVKDAPAAKKTGRYENPAPFESAAIREQTQGYSPSEQSIRQIPGPDRAGSAGSVQRQGTTASASAGSDRQRQIPGPDRGGSAESDPAALGGGVREHPAVFGETERKSFPGGQTLTHKAAAPMEAIAAGRIPAKETENALSVSAGTGAVFGGSQEPASETENALSVSAPEEKMALREEKTARIFEESGERIPSCASSSYGTTRDGKTNPDGQGKPQSIKPDTEETAVGTVLSQNALPAQETAFAGAGAAREPLPAQETTFAGAGAAREPLPAQEAAFAGRRAEVYEQQELLPGILSPKAKSRRRILGCAFRTYWIIEYGKELFLIDQHAAHEKVLYERLTKMYQESAVSQQMVSPPLIFTATLEEKALLDEYTEAFAEIGFEIEPFGGREYKVSAVPYHLSMLGSRALFTEMLDHLETSRDPKKLSIYILRIATEACKAAVKGGDMLSLPEAEALIDELFLCEDPYHCPHGRPTIISFTEKELEKRFKRIV